MIVKPQNFKLSNLALFLVVFSGFAPILFRIFNQKRNK
jgi:hypothetical protein